MSNAYKRHQMNKHPQTRPRSYNVFSPSTTEVPHFYGADDIQDENLNAAKTSTNKIKNRLLSPMQNRNNNDGQIHRDNKKITNYSNKPKKSNKTKCKFFGKLKKDSKSTSISPINNNKPNNNNKILWKERPSLQEIFKDELLLNALTKYMEKSYNSENLLFLQSVEELNDDTSNINAKITSIYSLYIVPNAEHQINLSHGCLMEILSKRNQFTSYNLNQKRLMFNLCEEEIQNLFLSSILPPFYRSSSFQAIAKHSKYYKPNSAKNNTKYSYTNDTVNNTPPIKLKMSVSTEAVFEFGSV